MYKALFCLLIFFSSYVPTFAYDLYVTEVEKPYDIVRISASVEERQLHLGTLADFPVMYEVELSEATDFTASLRQLSNGRLEPLPLGMIVVKRGERGDVTEVARFNPEAEKWNKVKDKTIGLTFWDSEVVVKQLEAGTYGIEISTPDNVGKYILSTGRAPEGVGYFEKLSKAYQIQDFFGYSIFRMLVLPAVYYPLGLLLLLFVSNKIRKYRLNL
ncbi:hypothetical protein H6785_03565 [Candidatus Nomurabacteria bacterium]|nr:hypothetical protein [Candidatus Kaiserbacteria bacterium]MCB9815625.1 hypothetical protein [Candidatus Nomurabacteria bacterium]